MDFLSQLIGPVLAKFKQSNPVVFGVIVLILMILIYTVEQGAVLGLFPVEGVVAEFIKWGSIILTALTGSSTFQFQTLDKQTEDVKETVKRLKGKGVKIDLKETV